MHCLATQTLNEEAQEEGGLVPFRIRKRFTMETAHQLESAHTKACYECIHGHSYLVELVVEANQLSEKDRMVLDFSCLKPLIQGIMDRWDHGLLLHENKRTVYEPLIAAGHLKRSKVHFFQENPTAEVLARVIYYELHGFLMGVEELHLGESHGLRAYKVRVHETSTGWAEFNERSKSGH